MSHDLQLDSDCKSCCQESKCSKGFHDYPALCCGYAHYGGLDHPVCCPSTHTCEVVNNMFQCTRTLSGGVGSIIGPVYGYPVEFTDPGKDVDSGLYREPAGDPSSTIGIIIAAILLVLFVGCLMKRIIGCCRAIWSRCFRLFCFCFSRRRPRQRRSPPAQQPTQPGVSSTSTSTSQGGHRVGSGQWFPSALTSWLPFSGMRRQQAGQSAHMQQRQRPGRDMSEYPETIEQRQREERMRRERQQQQQQQQRQTQQHKPKRGRIQPPDALQPSIDIESQQQQEGSIDNTSIFKFQRQKTIDQPYKDQHEDYLYDLPPSYPPPPPTDLPDTSGLPSPPSYKLQKSSDKWGYDHASAPSDMV